MMLWSFIYILDDLVRYTELWNDSTIWTFKHKAPGFSLLKEVLQEQRFRHKQQLGVAVAVCKLLHKLHDLEITQEGLTTDDIFVKKSNQVTRLF